MSRRSAFSYIGRAIPMLVFLCHLPGAVAEEAFQSHASIKKRVHRFLVETHASSSAPPQVQVGRLDSRLRLRRCSRPLEASFPPGGKRSGRVTVGVVCRGDKPWKVYVPAQVSILTQVVVAKRDLPRGHLIGPQDIELREEDASRLTRAYAVSLNDVVGRILKRALRRDRPLNPDLLESPNRIKRGATVTIMAAFDGIQVRMKGRALGSGEVGDSIEVENLSSKRKLHARVVSAGVVQVDI
ncbi:MAG TPA: flagellar basal body P-ring formation protein FlgA [Chromatiales bacterium]|nr:flagellar basal body P-ring formation protein FlgA [Chromatiales bacterium]